MLHYVCRFLSTRQDHSVAARTETENQLIGTITRATKTGQLSTMDWDSMEIPGHTPTQAKNIETQPVEENHPEEDNSWNPFTSIATDAASQQRLQTSEPENKEWSSGVDEDSLASHTQTLHHHEPSISYIDPLGPFLPIPDWFSVSESKNKERSSKVESRRLLDDGPFSPTIPYSDSPSSECPIYPSHTGIPNDIGPNDGFQSVQLSDEQFGLYPSVEAASISITERTTISKEEAPSALEAAEATTQLVDADDVRCPICAWAPQPQFRRNDKQLRQAVAKHRMRRHSGKLFQCPVAGCGAALHRADNIRPHVIRQHPEYQMDPDNRPRQIRASSIDI